MNCNLCGATLDFWDIQEDFSIHKKRLGYGTVHDGEQLSLQLCCNCMDRLISRCVVRPLTETIT